MLRFRCIASNANLRFDSVKKVSVIIFFWISMSFKVILFLWNSKVFNQILQFFFAFMALFQLLVGYVLVGSCCQMYIFASQVMRNSALTVLYVLWIQAMQLCNREGSLDEEEDALGASMNGGHSSSPFSPYSSSAKEVSLASATKAACYYLAQQFETQFQAEVSE